MTAISFTGLSSVLDRTVFTAKGPIVKAPVPILTGTGLVITSPTSISVPTASFNSGLIGKSIQILGSGSQRNDGTFFIASVPSPTKLILENSDFDITDVPATTNLLVALTNQLIARYNSHLVVAQVHVSPDPGDSVNIQIAVDLTSAMTALNLLQSKFNLHVQLGPLTHTVADNSNVVSYPQATNLASAIILVNAIRNSYEAHRINSYVHQVIDLVDVVSIQTVKPVLGTLPSSVTGPFNWTLFDPRSGQIADDPTDVNVLVNGSQASVDAVFGLLGAVILTSKPTHSSTVTVDYSFLANPPTQFERLNSSEFNLNQIGNRNQTGLPGHKYRARSSLPSPKNLSLPIIKSSIQPKLVGWKYKGYERAYSAVLNDPNTLLLNVPTNKIAYPVLQATVFEKVIRYDPTTLPQNSLDSWIAEGDLTPTRVFLSNAQELTLINSATPPFFTHSIDLTFPSLVSAAFRAVVNQSTPDGAFVGSCFGLSDGSKAALVGFLLTDANNLSSALVLCNTLKAAFNAHLIQTSVHIPNDSINSISYVDAVDLPSLIILTNALRVSFNSHVNKFGVQGVHQLADSGNIITSPVATTQDQVISILNEMRVKLNSHEIASNIHFSNDVVNSVSQVKQIGILTNRGFPEFQTSWNSYAVDWSSYKTYRIFRDSNGNNSLFLSGSTSPIVTALSSELPPISSFDGKFDPLQQVFFGSISKIAASSTNWAFIRVDINPLDSNQVGDNKSVDYEILTVPELDPLAPWIVVGQGGSDRISGGQLVVDSTSSAPVSNVAALGLSSGAYRGFLRYEPIMTTKASSSVEFIANVGYYTYSLDDRSSGVFIDDDVFSIHLAFLQSSPTSATVNGSTFGPFTSLNLSIDTLILSVDSGSQITIPFTGAGSTSTADLVTAINNLLGFIFAYQNPSDTPPNSRLQFISTTSGSASKIKIVGGSAVTKLGLVPGTYFGSDSSPEPKASWFGETKPDLDTPHWVPSGTQSAQMLFRTLRITDASFFDFLSYSLLDPLTTSPVFGPTLDWKFDGRLTVQSFVAGALISGLSFCGALMNIDEGIGGKNIELQLSVDNNGIPFLNVLSFSNSTNTLIQVTSVPFTWNDKKQHTFNLFTSKGANTVILLADGVVLTTFAYSALQNGVSGPSITFGSGGLPILNADLRTAKSVVDWSSIAIFRDKKVSDPTAASRRYIGLYKGGDSKLLSSYYLQQVDWTAQHTYRIVRDPTSTVSVFLDGAQVPVISVNYDVLSLPPVSSSFLSSMTGGKPVIAFGSFNPFEIDRTIWTKFKYSIGKITLTNRLIPSHQTLNQSNMVSSPDHLSTNSIHIHSGLKVYSGGSPVDDFLADSSQVAFINLGEGTPPIPMTQDLQSRGGLVQSFTPVESLDSLAVVNQPGFLSNFEHDTTNQTSFNPVISVSTALSGLISRANDLRSKYNSHIISVLHPTVDTVNTITSPVATDLSSSLILINELITKFNAHLSQIIGFTAVHINFDQIDMITVTSATDLSSAVSAIETLASSFSIHILGSSYHVVNDVIDIITTPSASDLTSAISLVNDLKSKYNIHRQQLAVHLTPDITDVVTVINATDLASAIVLSNSIASLFNTHSQSTSYHNISDATNLVVSSPATDLTSLLALINEVKANYNSHLTGRITSASISGPVITSVHVIDDNMNQTVFPSPYQTLTNLMQSFTNSFNSHRIATVGGIHSHLKDDYLDALLFTSFFKYSPTVNFNLPSVLSQINKSKAFFNKHLISTGTHSPNDLSNKVMTADCTDILSAIILMNSLKSQFNSHIVGQSYHTSSDTINTLASSPTIDPLSQSIALANELQKKINSHFLYKRSHAHTDLADFILSPQATNLASLLVLVNEEQTRFNSHLTSQTIHISNDLVNTLTSPVAIDLQSAVTSLNEIRSKYLAHLSQIGVHGSSVFVRIDAPSRVAYESTKFLQFPTGDAGHLSPFSDDETWKIDGFKAQVDHTLTFPGGALPERASLVGNNIQPFSIVAGDILNVGLDGAIPISIVFGAPDTTTINVVSRINSTLGIPLGFAQDNGEGKLRLTSSTNGPSSAIALSGTAVTKLGLDAPQSTPWTILSGDPTAVTVVPMTQGLTDFIRYSTNGLSGTTTTYRNRTGLPDVTSMDFDTTFSIRIQSSSPGPSGDTGIYLGVSGIAGSGFTVALGFDFINGVRFVKLVDLLSGTVVYQRAFNWGDGLFHIYKISRVIASNSLQFSIIQ